MRLSGSCTLRRDVVGDVLARHAVVGGDEAEDDEEVARGLGDADALLLHLLRQQRHRQLELVLHLHLRDVGFGALLEGQRDRARVPSALLSDVR